MSPGFVIHVAEQIANALDYLHHAHPNAPVVHRDIKPANILVNTAGNALLIDLGAAAHPGFALVEDKIFGTPPYMAPEQYDGDEKPQTDQFALAMMIYQMLTGRLVLSSNPDREKKQMVALRDSGYAKVRKGMAHLPTTVETLIRAMAYNWQDRYASCEEFVYDLRRALVADGVSLDKAAPPAPTPSRTLPWGYVAMAAVAVAALALLLFNPFTAASSSPLPDPIAAEATLAPTMLLPSPPPIIGFATSSTPGLQPTTELVTVAPPTSTAVASGQVYPGRNGCAMRETPSFAARIEPYSSQSRFIPSSVGLMVLEQRGSWYQIRLPDGRSGWCPAEQLALATRSEPAPPVYAVQPAPPQPQPTAPQSRPTEAPPPTAAPPNREE